MLIIFSNTITPRLQYVADFISRQLFAKEALITADENNFNKAEGLKIAYTVTRKENCFWIQPHQLLFETGIKQQDVTCFLWTDKKAFFKTSDDLGFDIFAAVFYLLSRYEEYLPHNKDEYGRYAHTNSIAFKEIFLDVPLINIWINQWCDILKNKFPQLAIYNSSFSFVPTYDIDEAFAYKHKQWWRTCGGLLKNIFTGNFKNVGERINVLRNKQKDPYDAYGWMNQLHEQYNLKPYYFFLVAQKNGRYDKNILPSQKVLQQLIKDHKLRYPVGVHPSWQSGDDNNKLKSEIGLLGNITGTSIKSSRQHYIRFTLPQTYRKLIANGIEFDFSMGYGSINGFRASVASPFYWYDIEKETATSLLLFPFCFMEVNSFFEQQHSSQQALQEMMHYYTTVKAVNGQLIFIWHNTFLGTAKKFEGWKEMYEHFLQWAESSS